MADPFDFSQLGIPEPTPQGPGPDPRIVSGGPASGIPQEMQPRAPANDAELADRTSGWERFFATLANDGNLQQSLLSFGATALQPRVGGQTQAGQIGKALQAGQETYQTNRRADTQEGFQQQQLDVSRQNAATYARTGEAQAAATDASRQRADQMLPEQLKLIREQLTAAHNANDPQLVEMQLDRLFGEIQLNGARTEYQRALTEYLPSEIQAKAASAGRDPAAVTTLKMYTAALMATDPQFEGNPELALRFAVERLNQDRRDTPEQFRASLIGEFQTANLLGDENVQRAIENVVGQYTNRYYSTGAPTPSTPTVPPVGQEGTPQPRVGTQREDGAVFMEDANGNKAWVLNGQVVQ